MKEDVTVGFRRVDETAAPEFFIKFLDDCAQLESVRICKAKMSSLLDVSEGETVLDIGCGLGHDVRSLAQKAGSRGRVIGVDQSQAMIDEARKRTNNGLPLEFRVADACQLDFADETFDACRAERVLMHLAEPQRAIDEMVRVTRRGGRLVVFDLDWQTLSINNNDQRMTRSIAQLMCEQINNGRVGRELNELFTAARLAEIVVMPQTLSAPLDFWHQTLNGPLEQSKRDGKFSSREIKQWWRALNDAHDMGTFLGTIEGFIVRGRKS